MCPIIRQPSGPDITNVGQLRTAMPVLVLTKDYHAIPNDPAICMCPIDIPATAKANGRTVKEISSNIFELLP